MPRIRTIKPEFFVSEQIADVSPTCRLLFVGMWLFCDDAGIHPASARQLKMEVFPGDDITTADICRMVADLVRVGLVAEYSVGEESQRKSYWQVTGWHHQKIERPRYQYPPPDSPTARRHVVESSPTPRSPRARAVPDPTVPETTGEEKTTPRKRGISYPEDFEAWWAAYPKRVGKVEAAKAYRAALKLATREVLLAAAVRFAGTPKGRGEYCWNPATWLNQGHWEDDPKEWQERHGSGGNGEMSHEEYERDRQRRLQKTRDLLAQCKREEPNGEV